MKRTRASPRTKSLVSPPRSIDHPMTRNTTPNNNLGISIKPLVFPATGDNSSSCRCHNSDRYYAPLSAMILSLFLIRFWFHLEPAATQVHFGLIQQKIERTTTSTMVFRPPQLN
jgi:hypothetical protein